MGNVRDRLKENGCEILLPQGKIPKMNVNFQPKIKNIYHVLKCVTPIFYNPLLEFPDFHVSFTVHFGTVT